MMWNQLRSFTKIMHMTLGLQFVLVNKNLMTMVWFNASGTYAQGKDLGPKRLKNSWIRLKRYATLEKLDVDVKLICMLSATVKANTI